MTERKRAPRGQGGVYDYTTRSGEKRYRFLFRAPDPLTGVLVQTTRRGFKTQTAAASALRKALNDIDAGQLVRPNNTTFNTYADEWLQRQRIKESTRYFYGAKLRLYLKPAIGTIAVQKLTPGQIDKLYRQLEAGGGKDGKALSPHSVRHAAVTLNKVLAQAVRDGLIATNPAERATPPTARESQAGEMRTWTADQLGRFLGLAEGHRLYALFVLYATTGMRRGEALGLRWDDLELDRGRLTVHRSVTETAGRVVVTTTKTNRARGIDLDPFTVAVLQAHRVRQTAERLRAGTRWVDENWVFGHSGQMYFKDGPVGGVLQPDSVWRAFKTLLKAINLALEPDEQLPDMTLHGLRHSWATLALQDGVHYKIVQERLGHSTPQITLAVYSHVGDTLQRDAADTVASRIFKSAQGSKN